MGVIIGEPTGYETTAYKRKFMGIGLRCGNDAPALPRGRLQRWPWWAFWRLLETWRVAPSQPAYTVY